jgi:aldehyde:ferredoxin oxidoreductase
VYGYHGRILIVDLTVRQARWEPLPEDVLRHFLGGIGLGTYLLYRFCPPHANPLGPDNPLIFATSPLVGTRLTTSSKFAVVSKSPLTDFIGDSLSSSFLATELKGLGCDALVITGRASGPTLLFLDATVPPSDGAESREATAPSPLEGLSSSGAKEEGGARGSLPQADSPFTQPQSPSEPVLSEARDHGEGLGVRFLPAHHLLGLSTFDTEARVKEQLGDRRIRVACIGPAGENVARYASIANDGGRHAGRTGSGAVMGSKNLKAIAVRGRLMPPVRDADRLNEIGDALTRKSLGPATEKYRVLGTMANVAVFNRLGALPTRNFQQSTFDGADAVSGEQLYTAHRVKDAHCATCTIGCEKFLVTKDAGPEAKGRMEYETLFALGPLLGIKDPNAVIRAARLCDELGLDTISAGVTIAWAMECAEKGIALADTSAYQPDSPSPPDGEGLGVRRVLSHALNAVNGAAKDHSARPKLHSALTLSETNGNGLVEGRRIAATTTPPNQRPPIKTASSPLEGEGRVRGSTPRFGDPASVLRTLELIAHRQGIGNLLAEGTRRASAITGHRSDAWAMHVKGLEMPGYEPRSLKTMALGLAVSTRGACHNRSSAYEADFSSRVDRLKADDQRGAITAAGEDFEAVMDSLTWCKFLRKAFDDFWAESAEVFTHSTGWHATPDDLKRAGERICTLKKLFNIREGWTAADDTLPPRALTEALPDGVAPGITLTRSELDLMIASYYRARGWTEDGLVPDDKLRALGLIDVVGAQHAAPLRHPQQSGC